MRILQGVSSCSFRRLSIGSRGHLSDEDTASLFKQEPLAFYEAVAEAITPRRFLKACLRHTGYLVRICSRGHLSDEDTANVRYSSYSRSIGSVAEAIYPMRILQEHRVLVLGAPSRS